MSSWGVMEGHLGWGSCSTTTVVVVEEAEAEAEAAAAAGYWRKGPWTAEEDKLLIQYVKLHGEGRWNSVSRLAGLKRNGKSCRLRWVNYLRPDLKRGQITPQEESIIVELHARWGNRWSTIARSLPGRTDNEIKNYWRTHFKKKTKLPLDNSEKARNRLLKRQQFHRQQKEQQELQLQQQQHQHQQQQQQLLWQLNQLDMKKIMSLLDDSTTTNINNNPMPHFSGRQQARSCCNPPTTVAYPNSSITGDQQHGIFFTNGMFSVVNNNNNNNATCGGGGVPTSSASSVMVAAGEASADEEVGIWDDDGLWNLEELHAAAVGSGRAANIPNLVAPFC